MFCAQIVGLNSLQEFSFMLRLHTHKKNLFWWLRRENGVVGNKSCYIDAALRLAGITLVRL